MHHQDLLFCNSPAAALRVKEANRSLIKQSNGRADRTRLTAGLLTARIEAGVLEARITWRWSWEPSGNPNDLSQDAP